MSRVRPDAGADPCAGCPSRPVARLERLGLEARGTDFVVALAGNPNTGKSTVFNALTGLRQHTGNWPGKTVTRAEGAFAYDGRRYRLVDLPGTYSLLSTNTDEEVARDFLLFEQPDVTVIVADAARLERNLNLALQILEITTGAVLCVNLVDEAERHGLRVDARQLARDLGIPVVLAAARQGRGIGELLAAIADVATGRFVCRPARASVGEPRLERAVGELERLVRERFPGLGNARWVALRLLEGDARIVEAVRSGRLRELERPARRPEAMP